MKNKSLTIGILLVLSPILFTLVAYPDSFSLSWNQGRGGFLFAMAFIVAGVSSGNYNEIDNIDCINSSFPEFIEILKKKGCTIGLTTKVDIANLCEDNAYTLERLDTNDLPRAADAEPNSWTQKIL